jgi:site-specific DNA-methyltransferase (adenine-specific)
MELTKQPTKSIVVQKQQSIFRNWLNNQLSPETRKTYSSVLKSFESFLRSHEIVLQNIGQIKTEMAIAYRDHLINRGLANKSVNLHLATLASVCDTFVYSGDLRINPIARVKRPDRSVKKPKPHLTDRELERLFEAFSEKEFHLKTVCVILGTTAQRGTSILKLKKKHVLTLDERLVLSLKLKGGKQRLLPLPMLAEKFVRELLKDKNDEDFLFVGRGQKDKHLTLRSFNKTLKAKARKAKIKKEISSHVFRRSLVHKLIIKGFNLDKIKDGITFHADIKNLYEYRGNQHYELKENPLLALEYHKTEERDDYATPKSLISRLERAFGRFDLDVCASQKNSVCEKFFDKDQNGLEQDWQGSLVWVNPPYSQKNEFIEKAHREAQKGTKIIMLFPAFTETKWFADLKEKSDWLLFLTGRLVFNEHEQKETAKFSSVLGFFNIERTELADLGWTV